MRRTLTAGLSILGLLALAACSNAAAAGTGPSASAGAAVATTPNGAPPTTSAASDSIESLIKGTWHCSQAAGQYVQFNAFGSTFSLGSGTIEGEATFTDTTFKMGAGNSFLTGTWAIKDGTVTLTADATAPTPNAPSKTTTVSNFPTSTQQLNGRVRVTLQSASTSDQPYNFAYIQANGPKSVVITGAQNRNAICTKD